MKYNKIELLSLAAKVEQDLHLTPEEIHTLQTFEKKNESKGIYKTLRQTALPLSLALGFFFSVFPDEFSSIIQTLPRWTNFSPHLLAGVDYLWDLLGDPVGKTNIFYHIPNVILYSFGILGIKKLFDALDKRTWLDRVITAQATLQTKITNGIGTYKLGNGHSLLFVGKGDFIGMQFVLNHSAKESITISEFKPSYTDIWNHYKTDSLYDDLKKVIERAGGDNAGEYIFFPVKDDQIFLPAPTAYDLSPHKIDILCQNIRTVEKKNKWDAKRIIIIGDKYHKSFVQSEDEQGMVANSEDTISLDSITHKYANTLLLDPTEIVLKKIIEIAAGRKIVFRATQEGIKEYKSRFYDRLTKLGYKAQANKKGVLTIGHDIFEDLKEQQMLAKKIDEYYPVVLSKAVFDALIRNGYNKKDFLYVPDLVLKVVSEVARQQ